MKNKKHHAKMLRVTINIDIHHDGSRYLWKTWHAKTTPSLNPGRTVRVYDWKKNDHGLPVRAEGPAIIYQDGATHWNHVNNEK